MIDKKARDYLLAIPLWTKKKNTLDEVRHFLKELGNPDEQLRIIHVAGTNGKGSVCADLTAMTWKPDIMWEPLCLHILPM